MNEVEIENSKTDCLESRASSWGKDLRKVGAGCNES